MSSASFARAQAKFDDVCAVLPVADLNTLVGSKFSSSNGGKKGVPCTYSYRKGAKPGTDVAVLTGVNGKGKTSLQVAATQLGKQFGLTQVKPVQVTGATSAYQVSGRYKGFDAAVVVAERDGVIYDAIGGGGRATAVYLTAMSKVVTALIQA